MRLFKTIAELPERAIDAYVEWYRHRYIPDHGDLVTNTRDFWVGDVGHPYMRPYSFPNSKLVKSGTPMVCVGGRRDPNGEIEYVFRFDEMDAIVSERSIIYIRVVSRQRNAQG